MLKKLGIPVLALSALMALATAPQARAEVRFGITIGGPVYRAPVPVYSSPYSYADPYYAAPAYGYDYGYAAPLPFYPRAYYAPAYGYGYRNNVRFYDRSRRVYEYRGRDAGHHRR